MILTIGIVLYNEENQISRLAKNLEILRPYRDKVEVLIVDNASTDRTSNLLQELKKDFEFELLHLIENNLGFARQKVLQSSQALWVAYFDSDCEINEDWLPQFFKILPKVPDNVAAIGGNLLPGGSEASLFQHLFSSPLGHFNSTQAKKFRGPELVKHIPTANVFYRRKCALDVGGFREKFSFVGEDLDLSYRLRQNDYYLQVYPELSIIHIVPDDWKDWARKVYKYGRGRALVGYEHQDLTSMRYILPLAYIIGFVITLLSRSTLFVLLWLAYLSVISISALMSDKNISSAKLIWFTMVTHFSYALGMSLGLLIIVADYRGKQISPVQRKSPSRANK